ncbi:MAG TPA: VOC family protein [Segeticoccus sp.]|uniref:VOC family protein n=1 Tax=Segeticoccus sp. TaxID=2706531 RepID=UPI002D7FEA71|nr:VOC family protein [Segeticoccus sp.]HET8601105.1 VOC family protein [Segeticoccus sp.]
MSTDTTGAQAAAQPTGSPIRVLPGTPCWIDLFTSDPDKSTEFYGQLFGWTAGSPSEEFGGYFMFFHQDRPVAGGMRNDGRSGQGDLWQIYLATPDIGRTLAATTEHGGVVHVDQMAVADLGSMGMLTDAGGSWVGAWQADTFPGFAVRDEPGSPGWFELHTRDYEKVVAFYRDVFGWDPATMSDTPEFRYTTLGTEESRGGSQGAGIMDVSRFPEDPFATMWSIYFVVADADAAAAKVTELGGQVIQGVDETPFGRLVTCVDPTGARFKLVQNPTEGG